MLEWKLLDIFDLDRILSSASFIKEEKFYYDKIKYTKSFMQFDKVCMLREIDADRVATAEPYAGAEQ